MLRRPDRDRDVRGILDLGMVRKKLRSEPAPTLLACTLSHTIVALGQRASLRVARAQAAEGDHCGRLRAAPRAL